MRRGCIVIAGSDDGQLVVSSAVSCTCDNVYFTIKLEHNIQHQAAPSNQLQATSWRNRRQGIERTRAHVFLQASSQVPSRPSIHHPPPPPSSSTYTPSIKTLPSGPSCFDTRPPHPFVPPHQSTIISVNRCSLPPPYIYPPPPPPS